MSDAISLKDYTVELAHAAGPGAAKVASSVTASGNLQAKTGVAATLPGPGLQAVLAQRDGGSARVSDAANAALVPKVADRMAKDALRQGAGLLSGDK